MSENDKDLYLNGTEQDTNHYGKLLKEKKEDIEETGRYEDEILKEKIESLPGDEVAKVLKYEETKGKKREERRKQEAIENVKSKTKEFSDYIHR